MSRATTLVHSRCSRLRRCGPAALGQLDVVVGVAASNRGGVAARVESLLGVLADGLEQPVPHPAVVVVVGDDEGLVDQLTQHVDHIDDVEVVAGRTASAAGQVTAAREHRQPVQRVTFRRVEQVIGPVDRAPQRLVALERGAAAAGEELEPLIEAGNEILG